MAITHTFQSKNGWEALFASVTDLRKAPKWLVFECKIFFAFHNLVSPQDTRKKHVHKNWDANISYTLGKVIAGVLFSVANWRKAE